MLTVADLVAVPELGLTLAAGREGDGRGVRCVHSSELDDPTPFLRGGELLLTTGRPLARDGAGFVRRLAGHGLAGLGLGLGFGFQAPPADAAAAADELGFPLLSVPYDVPFIAISEAVFDRVAGERLRALEELTELVLRDLTLDELLGQIAGRAGAELELVDDAGRALARSPGFRSGGDGPLRLPVVCGSAAVAELRAQTRRGCDRQLLHHAQIVLGIELLKRRIAQDAEGRLAGDLIDAVVEGDAGERELRRKLRAFGLAPGTALALVVLRPRESGAAALALVLERARRFGPAAVRDGGVAVLVPAAGDNDAESLAARLLREAGAAAAGVGRVRTLPSELHACYDEALYAVEAQDGGPPGVATYRDLGSMQLLLSLQDERGVELFWTSLLGPLIDHDRDHGSALVESLRAYLEANGKWAEAAAALAVHRHTLRYRVRKIEELTGRDLAQAGDRLELWLALRALEMRTERRERAAAAAV